MDNKLQKLIDLSRKTGDRIISFDQSGQNDPYVVMSVDEYEKIIVGKSEVRGLTEDEMLDKINRDIAIWKSDLEVQENSPVLDKIFNNSDDEDLPEDEFYGLEDDVAEEAQEEENDWYSLNEITKDKDYDFGGSSQKKISGKTWAIPRDRKKNAEEIIEEDRYYLEEIDD